MRPALEIRIEELVVIGLDVDREQVGPAVEAALAARLDAGIPPAGPYEVDASSPEALADGVAACLHDAIAGRFP